MINIHYERLTSENFNDRSLDEFIRLQTSSFVWIHTNGEWSLENKEPPIVWDWNLDKRRMTAKTISDGIQKSGFGYGAFCEGKVIGYIFISGEFWGSQLQYTELKLFHISAPFRNHGIGKELFRLGCKEARIIGAKKLYISANHSKESQSAYRKLGCLPATEINRECAEREPFDIQMEYIL